jgi:hypothetical protein
VKVLLKIVKFIWIGCCIGVLLMTLRNLYDAPGDSGIFFAYAMAILTFPVCGAIFTIFGGVSVALMAFAGYSLPDTRLDIFLEWLVLFSAGYWQWFIFVPWLITRERPPSARPLFPRK